MRLSKIMSAPVILLAFTLAVQPSRAREIPAVTVGDVRVQVLSGSLVRLELRGPKGFEDRPTFHVLNRDWPGAAFSCQTNADTVELRAANFTVKIPRAAHSLAGVVVAGADGAERYRYDGKLENSRWLPSPGDRPQSWWFADAPRLVPAAQGLTPAPGNAPDAGWDIGNGAPDVYVFLPRGDYRQLRADFLKLTGPTELPPLFLFGAFDSRWYDYTEATALAQVEAYRQRRIPLDVLVVDTGWRANASTGYQPNTNLFPDMPRFIREAHEKNVRVLFNDHPEPLNTNWPALDARELNYRFNGLAGLLQAGLDVWWYDRNWWVALVSPAPNLRKEVWGMRLYHDTTARVNPTLRPLIMANVDGIDNGKRLRPPDVASHRFPFQWSGDIGPGFEYLRRGVENAVQAGVNAAFPYMSEDLGGHTSNPTTEAYIRWIEYGALSPVYRPHCTHNLERMPWAFGPEAERIARNFVDLRYRLLPVFYAASHDNYETGEPLLRRLDLEFPGLAEAKRDDEYLLGRDLLVAPVLSESVRALPPEWLQTPDGRPGLRAEYFANETLGGEPVLTRTDSQIDFDWGFGSPDARVPVDHFTARWTGSLRVPATAGEVVLSATSDDGVRVWLDDQLVIDNWQANDFVTRDASVTLKPGETRKLRVEYLELTARAAVKLRVRPVTDLSVARESWLPPGTWIDAWSGERFAGPRLVTNNCPLDRIPLYVRAGAVLALAPEMQFTGEKPWSPVTLDDYLEPGKTATTTLYEDDTRTTAYQHGEFRKTEITAAADDARRTFTMIIGAAKGTYAGALKERAWILRFRRPAGWPEPRKVEVNGRPADGLVKLASQAGAMPCGDAAGAPDGEVYELKLPARSVTKAVTVTVGFR
jgi:Glycosyl hydrolases family 31/PA14 domain/Domain of unknown function (DUF5110)